MFAVHKGQRYTPNTQPLDGRPSLLYGKKSFSNQSSGYKFSEETIQSLKDLGKVLRKIRKRILSEGYKVVDGKVIKDEDFK